MRFLQQGSEQAFWSDPFLWIHLAGVAALPIFLAICLLGLAVGSPILPVWLEVGLVGALGILPVVWMQMTRPFYIFSILLIAIQPEKLTEQQRRILSGFKTKGHQILTVVSPLLLLFLLGKVYQIAPLAADVAPFPPSWRIAGLLLATAAYAGCNLFLQVPVSVLGVLFTEEEQFLARDPLSVEQIRQDFTRIGWPVKQIFSSFDKTGG